MTQTRVGIRELEAHLSAYLRRVKAGGTVIITERDQPIARIVPLSQPREQAGLIAWSGHKLPPLVPVAQAKGERTLAELLLEDRE